MLCRKRAHAHCNPHLCALGRVPCVQVGVLYPGGVIQVGFVPGEHWDSALCTHSGVCFTPPALL